MGYLQGPLGFDLCQALAPGSIHTWLSASETLLLPGALGSLGVTSIYTLGRGGCRWASSI